MIYVCTWYKYVRVYPGTKYTYLHIFVLYTTDKCRVSLYPTSIKRALQGPGWFFYQGRVQTSMVVWSQATKHRACANERGFCLRPQACKTRHPSYDTYMLLYKVVFTGTYFCLVFLCFSLWPHNLYLSGMKNQDGHYYWVYCWCRWVERMV